MIGPGLATLAEKHPVIGEVRGAGVFWALELVADRGDPRAALRGTDGPCQGRAALAGLLPFIADNRIHVVPPCVVTADEVAQAMVAYDAVLTLLDEEI